MVSISVITATLNAGNVLQNLVADLLAQTDQNFDWVLVDGGSTDDTLSHLPDEMTERIILIQGSDFGIYDALNKGIRRSRSVYYLVIGADDRLHPDAIAKYRQLAAASGSDIVAASVYDSGCVSRPGRGKPWLRGQNAYVSHHSAGTLVRKSLHDRFGEYSRSLPIAADQLFIKTGILGGAKIHYAPEFIAGEFSRTGVSSVQFVATLFEFTIVQLRTEKLKTLQLLLFTARLLRHCLRIIR